MRSYVIIGLGGIGSVLVEKVARFLSYSTKEPSKIILVDGDSYEHKNLERQEFLGFGNKAEMKKVEVEMKFPMLEVEAVPHYLNGDNVHKVVNDEFVVFVAVDNHKTRKIVSDYARTLKNVTIISGGNELTDGNVQRYIREEGKDVTPSLTDYHPEIDNPADKLPEEMSCEELHASSPQLFFTNVTVATLMCQMLHNTIRGEKKISEVYFDLLNMCTDAKIRQPLGLAN